MFTSHGSRIFDLRWIARSGAPLLVVLGCAVGCSASSDTSSESSSSAATEAEGDAKSIGAGVGELAEAPVGLLSAALARVTDESDPVLLAALHSADEALAKSEWGAVLDEGVATVRRVHEERRPLWEALVLFAGDDGLLNHGDVAATLACTDADELHGILDFLLEGAVGASRGIRKKALEGLRERVRKNEVLPAPTGKTGIFDLLSKDPAKADAFVEDEVRRRVAETFTRECRIPTEAIHTKGIFDLVRAHCPAALDLRAQGVLAGVFGLRNVEASKDAGGTCANRKLTFARFRDLYTRFGPKPGAVVKSTGGADALRDFVRVQASKYFGPQGPEVAATGEVLPARGIGLLADTVLPKGVHVEPHVEGGLPVRAITSLLDQVISDDKLRGADLLEAAKGLGRVTTCDAFGVVRAGKRGTPKTYEVPIATYPDEATLRAFVDPAVDATAAAPLIRAYVTSPEHRSEDLTPSEAFASAKAEAEANKKGAFFRKFGKGADATYSSDAVSRLELFGTSSYLAHQEFATRPDGVIVQTVLLVEQEVDGAFVTASLEGDASKHTWTDYDGYAVSRRLPGEKTACLTTR
ncbi:MAG: hypothetical protein U0169_26850 [Polyangiaceae bacterium]